MLYIYLSINLSLSISLALYLSISLSYNNPISIPLQPNGDINSVRFLKIHDFFMKSMNMFTVKIEDDCVAS